MMSEEVHQTVGLPRASLTPPKEKGIRLESWRELAIELFPEQKGVFTDPRETIWSVLGALYRAAIQAHQNNNINTLKRIYKFAEWCHAQREVEPEISMAACTEFYEPLVEQQATYRAISRWVSPEVFRAVLPEFEDRLDNKMKYPSLCFGTFSELLLEYNTRRGTNFSKRDIDK